MLVFGNVTLQLTTDLIILSPKKHSQNAEQMKKKQTSHDKIYNLKKKSFSATSCDIMTSGQMPRQQIKDLVDKNSSESIGQKLSRLPTNVPWSRLLRFIGDGHPTFNRNPYNGYINPYYWVDDHALLYGNNGSLDPGTNGFFLWNFDGFFPLVSWVVSPNSEENAKKIETTT